MPGRAYLYRLQLALGRSARGIQDRLADFAAQGDTETEAGLAALLQQTALELLREKDAVRYLGADAARSDEPHQRRDGDERRWRWPSGAASRSNGCARPAGGSRARPAPAEEGKEALELVVVTLVAATRTPLDKFGAPGSDVLAEDLSALLTELGGVSPDAILGLEVVWTPADPNDSMTETDVMTTYPDLRSL